MTTYLVLTVGTTADPLLKAVEEHRAQDPDLRVFLLYGCPFPGQDPSPFDVAARVKDAAGRLGVPVEIRQIADPEDLDACLQTCRGVLRDVSQTDRIVVDFTGGTKAMSAAVVHAALTESLAGRLAFEYTGGAIRDPTGRVLREAMRHRVTERTATDETIRQVLELLQRFAYREARPLAFKLPEAGRAGFLRRAVDALNAWDEFHYETCWESLGRLTGAARLAQDDPELAPLASLCLRLREPAAVLRTAVQRLRTLEEGNPGSPWPASEEMALLVADALENAARRLIEDRPTDGVLRAYRAVEVAVQSRLLFHGVNPWRPDWNRLDPAVLDRYAALPVAPPDENSPAPSEPGVPVARDRSGWHPPRELALTTGLRLVEALEGALPEDLVRRLRDLQMKRNRSYLEHGYLRVTQQDGKRLLDAAHAVCSHLMGTDLTPIRDRVSHRTIK
jgi:CRISPR-associated protein (TIGR02710 family)